MTRRARITYCAEELAWVEAHKEWSRADLHAGFVARYIRSDVTLDDIRALCARKKWSAGPDGRKRNLGKSRLLSAPEIAWLRANATIPRHEAEAAFAAAFPESAATGAQLIAWRKRNGVSTGNSGRFYKGQVPHNAGKKGVCAPGCEKGWFAKGGKPHNTKPDGYERICKKDGYVMIRVSEPNPWTGAASRMIHKHVWLWEKKNGPVPEGHALKTLDGNRLNTDPDNWIAVPRGLLPRLNGKSGRAYDAAPAEIKPTIMAIAQLEHAAIKAARKAAEEETK